MDSLDGGPTQSSGDAARLSKKFEESKAFEGLKEHLDVQLKSALNEPQAETPEFATNFLWQVCEHTLAI